MVGADGVRSAVADRRRRAGRAPGTGATAVVYGYWSGARDRRLRVVLPPRRLRRRDPHQRRPDLRLRRRLARAGSAGAASTCFRDDRAAAPPRRWPPDWHGPPRPPACAPSAACPGYLRRSYGPGWALVGDAGYWKDPISAHGLTDALRDAELPRPAPVDRGDEPPGRRARGARCAGRLPAGPATVSRPTCAVPTPSPATVGRRRRSPASCAVSTAMTDEIELIAQLDDSAVLAA